MSAHEVTLVFEDGRIVKFPASEDDNIYFAGLKNKVRLLTDCLEGACATCKGVCTRGDYRLDDYSDEALTQEEFDRREVLTCRMHATSDCVIEFPYESKIALKSAPATRPATVPPFFRRPAAPAARRGTAGKGLPARRRRRPGCPGDRQGHRYDLFDRCQA